MNDDHLPSTPCRDDADDIAELYRELPAVVKKLTDAWHARDESGHPGPIPIPSHSAVVQVLHQCRRILFPGYFSETSIHPANLEYCIGRELTELFENLGRQIVLAFQHECFQAKSPCIKCREKGHVFALEFIRTLPELEKILATDVQAALEGDPAAKGANEVIFSYPGILAITVFRIAHELYKLQIPVIPRIMTEHAHSLTGIDIHPGATIGERFFIDHGTGVVIGETTTIGKRVRIYQGVTLGALSLPKDAGDRYRNVKRHPTIEDDVIIYSNTTILGGETVIGARSIIGGNNWLTESVPADTKVLLKRPELIYIGKNGPKRSNKGG
ncbi:MAG: serine O-acetyltransferase EpsC [Thermodesulfobacteriota bacterium]